MKKVKVIVKDKMLLELDEDASKGDVIDLGAVTQVDLSYVDKLIENGKDKVYQNKLLEQEKLFNAKKQIEVNQLNEEIKALKKEQETLLQLKANEITNKYLDQINELKKQLDVVKNNYENQINNLTLANNSKINEMKLSNDNYVKDLLSKATLKYTNLENEYQSFKNQYQNNLELDKKKVELSYLNQITELKNQIEKNNLANEIATAKKLEIQKNDYDHLIKQKEETINQLMRSKSALNVKQTGEDLESWCDNEVNAYMQNGLFNCTWEKDNKVVRNEDETKGSKADYIFKVYAENQHINLLSSICMDMKDENPSSVNKKTNADYYKALDMNRNKKECKYALLVSNLELDKPNVLPIFKVREYEDMYVVRPAYLMVFLNMITSLTTRFSTLVLNKEHEQLKLKSKIELEEQFNQIKEKYLNKPLDALEKNINEISKNNDAIKKASSKIDESIENINSKYINQILDKLEKYEIQLNKIEKKIEVE